MSNLFQLPSYILSEITKLTRNVKLTSDYERTSTYHIGAPDLEDVCLSEISSILATVIATTGHSVLIC